MHACRSTLEDPTIVICADGTGNTTIKGRGSNVFKLYEAIDENGHRFSTTAVEQVAIYHDGVGTENLKWLRAISAATGLRVGHNVRDLYGELARVFDPGDRIFLFGFSRGAFTVRMLSGLITWCGIVDRRDPAILTNADFKAEIHRRYADYRRLYQTSLSRLIWPVDRTAIRRKYEADISRCKAGKLHLIDFIGVWDTVDAVGLPFRVSDVVNSVVFRFKFPDRHLSTEVAQARQALALDEERESFSPVLWCERRGPHRCGVVDGHAADDIGDPRIKQVWFAGVHSNIGGGYPNQGMSLVTLDWMMSEAESHDLEHPLRFIPEQRLLYRGAADVNGKLYDSRSGLGVFYRWKPRDAERLCTTNGVPRRVHRTVFERIARNTDAYAPGSLPSHCEVVTTSAGPAVRQAIAECLREAHRQTGGRSFVGTETSTVRFGRISYSLFLMAAVLLAAFTLGNYLVETVLSPLRISPPASLSSWMSLPREISRAVAANPLPTVKTVAAAMLRTGASSRWLTLMAQNAVRSPWMVGIFICSFLLGYRVNVLLDRRYSGAWFSVRNGLLKALHSPTAEVGLGRVTATGVPSELRSIDGRFEAT